MEGQQRLDIWFTQDALDADNLPAAKLTAIYAIQMLRWYETVHIWCDISTATRSLGRPRLLPDVVVDGNLFVEELGPTIDHCNENSVEEDTRLCQAYDASLLLVILREMINSDENIHLHVVLGGYPKQQIQDPRIPNTFLFVDLKTKTINTIKEVIFTQNLLEGIADQEEIYKEISREPWNNGEKVILAYEQSRDYGFENRRKRFHSHIKEQVKSFGILDGEMFNGDLFYENAERAIEAINNTLSDINILAFAPLTNTAKLVVGLQRKSRVKKVIGHLLTLEPLDNFVGVQWNEYLDSTAAAKFYTEIQGWEHGCQFFFSPTQCFVLSKNLELKEQKCLSNLREIINACCMVNRDKTNICLGFQKLWNLYKSKQLKAEPEWWTTKGEIAYDPLSLLYLLESLVHQDDENSIITKFTTCKVVYGENVASQSVILDSGRLKVPDLRNNNCINDDVIKSYLTAYSVEFDYQKVVQLVNNVRLYQEEENQMKKLEMQKKVLKLERCLQSEWDIPSHFIVKFVFIFILFLFFQLLVKLI